MLTAWRPLVLMITTDWREWTIGKRFVICATNLQRVMESAYHNNKSFEHVDYTEQRLPSGEYENCKFINCNFSNINLSSVKFIDSHFIDCNLSLAKLTKTAFVDVAFVRCKMIGLHFENCEPLGLAVTFQNCSLNNSSFYQSKLKKTMFKKMFIERSGFHTMWSNHCDVWWMWFWWCNLRENNSWESGFQVIIQLFDRPGNEQDQKS